MYCISYEVMAHEPRDMVWFWFMDRKSSDVVRLEKHGGGGVAADGDGNNRNYATNTTEKCKTKGFNKYY